MMLPAWTKPLNRMKPIKSPHNDRSRVRGSSPSVRVKIARTREGRLSVRCSSSKAMIGMRSPIPTLSSTAASSPSTPITGSAHAYGFATGARGLSSSRSGRKALRNCKKPSLPMMKPRPALPFAAPQHYGDMSRTRRGS